MNQDAEHLRLLSIFHYVVAGLIALFACFPLIHVGMGLLMALRPESFGSDPPPRFMGWLFIALGLGLILFGWISAGLLAWAGRCLSRRTHQTFCLVIAAIACTFVPFGTVLGVFTILVLARPSVKCLFERAPAPPPVT